jgi:hypothetical protein
MNRFQLTSVVAGAFAIAIANVANAQERVTDSFEDAPWQSDGGYTVQIDNDLFSLAHVDQDYSWGGGATVDTPHPGGILKPIHAARARIEALFAPPETDANSWAPEQRATQFGVLAMTPGTLRSRVPRIGDRPYASLFFMTGAQIRLLDGGSTSRFTSFSVGLLGLHLAEELHRLGHRAVGNELPLGWNHQISSGGEPTARYVEARQWLLGNPDSRRASAPEFKLTAGASAGYLSDANVALSVRWGRIQTPWWSFAPELGDYTSAPLAPVQHFSSRNPVEMFGFAGIKLKAIAYNALLQGQFRHSDYRVQGDDIARVQAEAWAGFATTWSEVRITYALHYASPELLTQPGRRMPIWGDITFEKSL